MKKISLFLALVTCMTLGALAQETATDVTKIKVITKENGKRTVQERTLHNATQEEIDATIQELKGDADADVISIDVDRRISGDGEQNNDVVIRIPEINVDIDDLREDLSGLSIEIGEEVRQALKEVGESLEEINGNRSYNIHIDRDDNDEASAFLGIESSVSQGIQGVLITKVRRHSAAQRAGLQVGDIIKKIDNNTVASFDELSEIIRAKKPQELIHISFSRDGNMMDKSVALGSKASKSIHFKKGLKDDKRLGVTVNPHKKGLKINQVEKHSRAEKLGLQEGDIITKIQGEKANNTKQFMDLIQTGNSLEIEIERNGKRKVLREVRSEK